MVGVCLCCGFAGGGWWRGGFLMMSFLMISSSGPWPRDPNKMNFLQCYQVCFHFQIFRSDTATKTTTAALTLPDMQNILFHIISSSSSSRTNTTIQKVLLKPSKLVYGELHIMPVRKERMIF